MRWVVPALRAESGGAWPAGQLSPRYEKVSLPMPDFLYLLILLAALCCFGLWVFSIIDVFRHHFTQTQNRWIWLAVIVLTYPVGPVVYLIAKMNRVAM
jgi:hypothetical protein